MSTGISPIDLERCDPEMLLTLLSVLNDRQLRQGGE